MQKSRRNKQKKATVQDLQPDILPASTKPESMPANDKLESSAVLVLISLFVAIIGQGLFLAVSVSALNCSFWDVFSLGLREMPDLLHCLQGFLPESWDLFAQNVVYKTFSPTVGIFLASSAGYGVWKVSTTEMCSLPMAYLYRPICGSILKNTMVPAVKAGQCEMTRALAKKNLICGS